MGHATAEAVVSAGLQLVPFTFSGTSLGVAVRNVGVRGIPVQVGAACISIEYCNLSVVLDWFYAVAEAVGGVLR